MPWTGTLVHIVGFFLVIVFCFERKMFLWTLIAGILMVLGAQSLVLVGEDTTYYYADELLSATIDHVAGALGSLWFQDRRQRSASGVLCFLPLCCVPCHHLPLTVMLTNLASSFFLGGYDLSFSFGEIFFPNYYCGAFEFFSRFSRARAVKFLSSTGNPIIDHEPCFCLSVLSFVWTHESSLRSRYDTMTDQRESLTEQLHMTDQRKFHW
jgi:hypothetical protein